MVAEGRIPAKIVFQDDLVIAFDDIHPQAPVHTLVIPREHYASLNDDVPAETFAAICSAVSMVAQIKGVSESGYRVIVNNGRDANQTVPHLHVHVLGGRARSHGMVRYADE
jgi:histidine triad (HIT) family protein